MSITKRFKIQNYIQSHATKKMKLKFPSKKKTKTTEKQNKKKKKNKKNDHF